SRLHPVSRISSRGFSLNCGIGSSGSDVAHFYLDEQLERASVGDRVTLSGAEARHAVTVSRIAVGETVTIGNGSGLVVSGPAVVAGHTELTIDVVDAVQHDARSPLLFLVQALAKGDRDELAV